MKIIEIEQGSPTWKEMRRSRIGGSDCAAIMGVSPWLSRYMLWEQKVMGKEIEDNDAMARGKRLEPIARDLYNKMFILETRPLVVIHEKYEWMMASLDGIDDRFTNYRCVEIKCAGKTDHELARLGYVPEKYQPQCQHILEVCGLDEMDYFSFDGEEGVVVKVVRDQPFIDKMIEKEFEFWQRIQTLDPPDLEERDYLKKDDDHWMKAANLMLCYRNQKKQFEQLEEHKRKELIEMAAGQNCLGAGVRVQKVVSRGRIQYDKIEALKGIDLESYRGARSESWKVTEYGS